MSDLFVSNRRSALDSALDVVLFAPVGLVVELQRLVPELAREGRTRVDQRVTLARFVGRHAVRVGRGAVEQRLAALRTSSPSPPRGSAAAESTEPTSAPPTIVDASKKAPAPARPGSTVETLQLPITGYDSLSASQVVSRLGALTTEELSVVAAYEEAHRRRRTVLGKVEQLRSRVA